MSKKGYRIVGENTTCDIADGVLTIIGTGLMYIDMETHYRVPLSSVWGWFLNSSSDEAWKKFAIM